MLALPLEVHATARGMGGDGDCKCKKERRSSPLGPLAVLGGAGLAALLLPPLRSERDLPTVTAPDLVNISADYAIIPRTPLEGAQLLAEGARPPDTATVLPAILLVATALVFAGLLYAHGPRRRLRRRRRWLRSARGGRWQLRTAYRRRIGLTAAGCGVMLLFFCAKELLEGIGAQARARREWLELYAQSRPAVMLPLDGASAMPMALPAGAVSAAMTARRGAPVARLKIPSIGLDEIVVEGVGNAELNGAPGHFPGSALPGDDGNSVISAHRDRHFRRIAELAVGDTIFTETLAGAHVWLVTERRIVDRASASLFATTDATLTLTTCWPVRYLGSAPDRLLIIAKRVSAVLHG